MVEIVIPGPVDERKHAGGRPRELVPAVSLRTVVELVGLPEDEDEDVDFEEGEDDGAG